MKKIIKIVVLFVAALALIIMLSDQNRTLRSVSFGLILPMTGEVASLGVDGRDSALLAYSSLPKTVKKQIKLIFEDDAFNPNKTVSGFHKLIDVDGAQVLLCFTSSPCSAVVPLAEEKQIPLFAIASAPVQQNRKFISRLEVSTNYEGRVLSDYVGSLDFKSLFAVLAEQDGVNSAYRSFVDNLESVRIDDDKTTTNNKDFRTAITKALVFNPDVILIGLMPGQAGTFMRQAREMGYRGEFVGFNFIEGAETVEAAGPYSNGVVYTQVSDPQDFFVKSFESKYGRKPGPGAANVYDAVLMISRYLEQNDWDKIAFNNYIHNLNNFEGALGVYSSDHGEFTLPIVLKIIKNKVAETLTN